MTRIHPTAVIDERAELADDVEIGAYCVVDGPVRLGPGTVLLPHSVVMGQTVFGEGNRVFPGAVIGAIPQDLKYRGESVHLRIGDNNIFREHVTIHPGTGDGGGLTQIGSDNLFMVGSHAAHDCVIGSGCVISNHVLLAGHVRVRDGAIMNGASACHHYTTIGRLSYVGGLTRITTDVHPFTIVEGHPARVRAPNVVGMRRAGVPEGDVKLVKDAIFRIFISDKYLSSAAIEEAGRNHGDNEYIGELLDSIRAAAVGRQGRAAEKPRASEGEAGSVQVVTPKGETSPQAHPSSGSGGD